ncbi:NUDIX domain-containing protein [Saccharopolyspora kobensis]|uniref:NUDIX domain-containing protein n=1 Tax=Saccharopolyspora kobensis TaxID=146035 RepID=A0A1H6BJA2_9PSEU|nr:NUDIX domain-containing protein [Saccharopolyspora kobensis]SFE88298.1 NUDIX domain-containing protein [Saccharopolyspora kobensis]
MFEHRDAPEAGTQIPAGGARTGELLTEAARREVAEETGAEVEPGTALAVRQSPHPHTGEPRVTVFFHARTSAVRDAWVHEAVSGDGDDGMAFRCHFIPLVRAADLLADDQGECLHLLEGVL